MHKETSSWVWEKGSEEQCRQTKRFFALLFSFSLQFCIIVVFYFNY